ncbi:MAG: nitroreductase family protein [Gammaproteobacteria bacterium]|nr:nitroreductase family protein [Gammaproteobacteria bacterium]MDX5374816.1 nitroreductase family protein [Gammaproteobacteria bacterium]
MKTENGSHALAHVPPEDGTKRNTLNRTPDHPIDSIFLERWSPRSFDASCIPHGDLMTILEAARWAPSAYNIQPWRFIFALREDACWPGYLSLLDPFNAAWAKHASALVFLASDSLMPADENGVRKPSPCHTFDTGSAWAHLALQATALGYHTHAMAGIHVDRAAAALALPAHFQIQVAIAIGRQASANTLPEGLRQREQPSDRRPLGKSVFAGHYRG